MNRTEIIEKLNVIFRKNFNDASISLTNETSAADIDDWDSLEQINLVVSIQDRFKIKFNIDEVNAIQNVGGMVDFIMDKLKSSNTEKI